MKTLKLFVVASVATVAFASCGGGSTEGGADTTKKDSVVVAPADTTPVAPADSTKADTTKAK